MNRKAAKVLLHIRVWLERVDEIVERGKGWRTATSSSLLTTRSTAI